MRLAFLYGSEDNTMWFVIGFFVGFSALIALGFLIEKLGQWKEFKEFLKNKKPTDEVVDAQFVNVPRTQLNTSQALIRPSTSLTANQNKGVTKR